MAEKHDVGTTPGFNRDTDKALAAIKATTLILTGTKDLHSNGSTRRDSSRDSRLTNRLGRCQRTNRPDSFTPGRHQIGEVGEIIPVSPGDFKSVHPGDIVGIRISGRAPAW